MVNDSKNFISLCSPLSNVVARKNKLGNHKSDIKNVKQEKLMLSSSFEITDI